MGRGATTTDFNQTISGRARRAQFGQDTALLIVDAQPDFMPGGPLAAPEGDQVVAPLAAVAERCQLVAASVDAHPADHSSFKAQGGIWDPHCVVGTAGQRVHHGLERFLTAGFLFEKGVTRDADAYSAFPVTDAEARLRAAGIKRLLIGGLVTNVCVLETALDALAAGFEVVVVTDGVRAVPAPGLPSADEALARLEQAGARLATSQELLAELEAVAG